MTTVRTNSTQSCIQRQGGFIDPNPATNLLVCLLAVIARSEKRPKCAVPESIGVQIITTASSLCALAGIDDWMKAQATARGPRPQACCHWRDLLTEGQDVPTEVFRAGGQETQRVLLKEGPSLPNLINIPAAMRIGHTTELHETNFFNGVVGAIDGLKSKRMGHKLSSS